MGKEGDRKAERKYVRRIGMGKLRGKGTRGAGKLRGKMGDGGVRDS